MIEFWVENKRKSYVVTPNPEMVMSAQTDKEFSKALNQADLRVADGVGLRLVDKKIKRVAGADLVNELVKLAAKKGWQVMLLGGRLGAAERAASNLSRKYPNLALAALAGPQELEKMSQKEKQELVKKVNLFRPELLLVGFGHGKQEKWLAKNMKKLEIGVGIGVGGTLDYLAKPWLRAPKGVRMAGLEWWWRLVLQPWRVRRQLALVRFMGKVMVRK
jgi:N-acetylglucosaminyldiphosphoundecaprenol N-acetyl-beta-D-mannosaminyltransferase